MNDMEFIMDLFCGMWEGIFKFIAIQLCIINIFKGKLLLFENLTHTMSSQIASLFKGFQLVDLKD